MNALFTILAALGVFCAAGVACEIDDWRQNRTHRDHAPTRAVTDLNLGPHAPNDPSCFVCREIADRATAVAAQEIADLETAWRAS